MGSLWYGEKGGELSMSESQSERKREMDVKSGSGRLGKVGARQGSEIREGNDML